MFQRRSHSALENAEALIGTPLGQGTSLRAASVAEELLSALTEAYCEAATNDGARDPAAATDWSRVHEVLALLPAASWTTYGELAKVAGTHARPLGTHLASTPDIPNAHRVLSQSGKPSPDFRWSDPDQTASVVEVLQREGVRFRPDGTADPSQMLTAEQLTALLDAAKRELIDRT